MDGGCKSRLSPPAQVPEWVRRSAGSSPPRITVSWVTSIWAGQVWTLSSGQSRPGSQPGTGPELPGAPGFQSGSLARAVMRSQRAWSAADQGPARSGPCLAGSHDPDPSPALARNSQERQASSLGHWPGQSCGHSAPGQPLTRGRPGLGLVWRAVTTRIPARHWPGIPRSARLPVWATGPGNHAVTARLVSR